MEQAEALHRIQYQQEYAATVDTPPPSSSAYTNRTPHPTPPKGDTRGSACLNAWVQFHAWALG